MIESDIIKERILEIEENLKILEDLRKIDKERFKNDPVISKAAQHCLQICIQALLDICHHIIANNIWTRARDNKEAIEIIAQHNIIPEDLAKRISPMAGLRNILIHEYLKVDLDRIYEHLQTIEDFREFRKHILACIKSL